MITWMKSVGIIALVLLSALITSENATAATTIYDVRVADNSGFTQIHGKVVVSTEMQASTMGGSTGNLYPAPFVELFGLSALGEAHRAAFWLPWFSGGSAGTRLYGAMSGIDTPMPFDNFASDPGSIFSDFENGNGLVIAYSSMGQEDAFTYGNIYPTMTLLSAPILSITSSVPEPASWAMMLLGIGFVGGAMRTSRRQHRAALGRQ